MSGAQIAGEVARAISEAVSEVGEAGFGATLIVAGAPPLNPWDAPGPPPTEYPLTALVLEYPRSMIDGTIIQAEDRRVMIAATGPRPTTADGLRVGGVTYRIVGVRDIAPGGAPLYYELHCRA